MWTLGLTPGFAEGKNDPQQETNLVHVFYIFCKVVNLIWYIIDGHSCRKVSATFSLL